MSNTSVDERDISLQRFGLPQEAQNIIDSDYDTVEPVRSRIRVHELKPTDGGISAWSVLLAAFLFEALLWGFPVCFGVFQEYYTSLPEFASSKSSVALIGTIAQGICYTGAPFSAALTQLLPKYQRHLICFGWPLMVIGLAAGSFAKTVGILVLTQGVLYGIGFLLVYWPIMSMVNEWWVAKKGFAFGIIISASGASGAVLPFVFQALLDKYGHQVTLRATAVAIVVLTGPLIPLFKRRLPPSEHTTLARTDWSFTRKPLFWVYCLATVTQGLGFFFPGVYLPSYAVDIGLSKVLGAALLSVMAVSQFIGQLLCGYLSDKRVSADILAITSCAVATIAAFTTWGLGNTLPLLLVFSILYGSFGYGFNTLRVGLAKRVTNDPTAVMIIQAILIFCSGIGNLTVAPISASLIHPTAGLYGYGAGKYRELIMFTGSTLVASAVLLSVSFLGPPRFWTSKIRHFS